MPKAVLWFWCLIAQCAAQRAFAVEFAETQNASPNTGAKSTVKSNQDEMNLRNCMVCLYTKRNLHGIAVTDRNDVHRVT